MKTLVVGLVAGAVSLGAVPLAHAAFRDSAGSTSTFTTASLAAPTGAVLTRSCVTVPLTGVSTSGRFTATWTPSATSWAQQQRVTLLSGAVPVVERTVPTTDATAVFDVVLPLGTYVVRISTVYESWTAETTTNALGC